MANAKVAWQGWNSSNIAWDESTWGDAEEAITGLTATLGSVTASAAAGVTASGNAATSGLGSVTVTAAANVTATGSAGTTALGSVSLITNNTIVVNGNKANGYTGNAVTGGDANYTVTGLSATAELGTVIVWGNLIPDQTPSWSAVSPSQSPDSTDIAA